MWEWIAPHIVKLKFTWKVVAANCLPSSGFVGTLNGRPMWKLRNLLVRLDDRDRAARVDRVEVLVVELFPTILVNVLNGFRRQPLLHA